MMTNANPVIAGVGNYPAERCKYLRETCMMQARKRKDAGHGRAVIMEWVGHAYYWHLRVIHPDMSIDQCAQLVQNRAQAVNARIAIPAPIAELAEAPMHGAIAPIVDTLSQGKQS